MYEETHTVTLAKISERKLQDRAMGNQMGAMLTNLNQRNIQVRGLTLAADPQADNEDGAAWTRYANADEETKADLPWFTQMHLQVIWHREDGQHPEKYEVASFIRKLGEKAKTQAYGNWEVQYVNGEPYVSPEEDEIAIGTDSSVIDYADVKVPDDLDDYFSHLYGLDAQIAMVKSSLDAAIDSSWESRYHAVLVGPPGCGKSDICLSLKRALGEDAVWSLDATSTTKDGAIKEISERPVLPRIMVLEEAEKAPEAALTFLLGLMDQRAEVRKITARQKIQREAKMLVLCTVNDYDKFCQLQAGALESRSSNEVWFQRPGRDTLALILAREIGKINGNHDWAKPALDYAEQHNIYDPRKVISICMRGRDLWLDGTDEEPSTFAKLLDATKRPVVEDTKSQT
jgi:MoxR-like ATPase